MANIYTLERLRQAERLQAVEEGKRKRQEYTMYGPYQNPNPSVPNRPKQRQMGMESSNLPHTNSVLNEVPTRATKRRQTAMKSTSGLRHFYQNNGTPNNSQP